MPEALDNGSQPYSCPLGDCEMAGERNTHRRDLAVGKGQELHMSPT